MKERKKVKRGKDEEVNGQGGKRVPRPQTGHDLTTLTYELNTYSLRMYQMNTNQLPMSRLSRVIVIPTHIQTHAYMCHQITPRCFTSGQ